MAETALLEIEDDLHAWYGASHILHGISLHVNPGEVVALDGRNGAGKTTTLRAMMGLMPKATGRMRFAGSELLPLRAHRASTLASPTCRRSAASSPVSPCARICGSASSRPAATSRSASRTTRLPKPFRA
jgi:ABC-type branched-subunit amino acid transport system ATPase component